MKSIEFLLAGLAVIFLIAVIINYPLIEQNFRSLTDENTGHNDINIQNDETLRVNLRIASILFYPESPMTNADVIMNIFIENNAGFTAKNSSLLISINDNSPNISAYIEHVGSHENITYSFNHSFEFESIYDVTATITNPHERDFSDNSLTEQVFVQINQIGFNQTGIEDFIIVTSESHAECINYQCLIIDDPGENQCSSDEECMAQITVNT
jgi:hypothetical protein